MGQGDPIHYRLAEFKRNLFLEIREKFCQIFFQKISLGGPCPPNLTPDPYIPYYRCRSPRGAPDGEKSSGLAPVVSEKIEVENSPLAPPSGETGSGRGHVTSSSGRGHRGLPSTEVWWRSALTVGRYSRKTDNEVGPSNENQCREWSAVWSKNSIYVRTRARRSKKLDGLVYKSPPHSACSESVRRGAQRRRTQSPGPPGPSHSITDSVHAGGGNVRVLMCGRGE